MNNNIAQSAITDADGKSVNVGYWALHRLLLLDSAATFVVFAVAGIAQYHNPAHAFPFDGVAMALGSIWGSYSTALAATGLFLWGDK